MLTYFATVRRVNRMTSTSSILTVRVSSLTHFNLYTNTHTTASDNIDVLNRKFDSVVCNEPFDVVYTWVAVRIVWLESYSKYRNRNVSDEESIQRHWGVEYSLRSLERNAPWIRRLFGYGQSDTVLVESGWRSEIVTHDQIEHSSSDLPVFSPQLRHTYIEFRSSRIGYLFQRRRVSGITRLARRFLYNARTKNYLLGTCLDVRCVDLYQWRSLEAVYSRISIEHTHTHTQVRKMHSHRLGDGTCDLTVTCHDVSSIFSESSISGTLRSNKYSNSHASNTGTSTDTILHECQSVGVQSRMSTSLDRRQRVRSNCKTWIVRSTPGLW